MSLERFLNALTEAGIWHRVRGDGIDFRCPLPDHADRDASGSADWKPPVGDRPGRMTYKCHACGRARNDEIREALDLRKSDLYDDAPARPSSPRGGRAPQPAPVRPQSRASRVDKSAAPARVPTTSTVRLFTEADGTERYRLTRYDPTGPRAAEGSKSFGWEHHDPGDGRRWWSGKQCKGYCARCKVSFNPAETVMCPSCGTRRVCPACERGDVPTVQLYRLPDVLAAVEAGQRVWLCEGAKNADDLAAALPAGEVATTAPDGSTGTWEPEHTAALAGAAVTIVADRDRPGYDYTARVAANLRTAGGTVRTVRTPLAEPGADVSDHLAAGLPLAALEDGSPETWAAAPAAATASVPAPDADAAGASVTDLSTRNRRSSEDGEQDGKRRKKRKGDDGGGGNRGARLLEMALEEYDPVWATTGEHYLIPRTGPRVARRLTEGRRSFIAELCTNFHDRCGEIAESNHRSNVLLMLRGYAERTEPIELANRVARHEDSVLLDLGDESGRVVQISPDGWTVLPESPVLFGRTARTGPLPAPVRGGELDELWELVNVRPADRPLAEAELIGRYFPNMSHPLLALSGEAGTGKTSAAETLTQLVDPSPAPVISLPTDQKDWAVQVGQAHSLVLDNVAHLQQWQSDALCMSVTGGRTQFRALFTDGGLVSFGGQQCITLTAIDIGSQKADLSTRMLPVELERFSRGQRLSEQALKARREEVRPRLLGVLLDRMAEVMGALPRVDELDLDLPRLSDFARLCKALDLIDGGDADRYGDYLRLLGQQAETIADEDEVSAALSRWMRERERTGSGVTWEGTSTDLHAELTRHTMQRSRFWPETAVSFGKRLSTVVAPLREAGIEISKPQRSSRKRAYRITLTASELGGAEEEVPEQISPPRESVVAPGPETQRGPAAGEQATVLDLGPCSACVEVGPFCGSGGIADEVEPCVLCGERTAVRSACGAARHGNCRGGGLNGALPEPNLEPEAGEGGMRPEEQAQRTVRREPVRQGSDSDDGQSLRAADRQGTEPDESDGGAEQSGERREAVTRDEELHNFASVLRRRGIEAAGADLERGLEAFHDATDGLRMTWVGKLGFAIFARLSGKQARHKAKERELLCTAPEVADITAQVTKHRDHVVPGVVIEEGVEYRVTGCDVNAQYLAAAGSVNLGHGNPRTIESPRTINGYLNRELPGYFQLAQSVETGHSAFGALRTGEWITTHSAKYLTNYMVRAQNLDSDFQLPVSKAVVWDSGNCGRRLQAWTGQVRTARDRLAAAGPEDIGSRYALIVLKAMYSMFLGGMLTSERYNHWRGSAGQEQEEPPLLRPDWSDQLVTLANANMWRNLDKIRDERVQLLGVRRDSAWFLAPAEYGLIEPRGLTLSEQPGKWRVEPDRSGPLTEEMLAAYRKGASELFLRHLIRSARQADTVEGVCD